MDGWISNAQKLRTDIQSSQQDARDIVQQGEEQNALNAQVVDAMSKIRLLEDEVAFNIALEASLQRLQTIREHLDAIQQDLLDDRLENAVNGVHYIDDLAGTPSRSSNPRIAASFTSRAEELRSGICSRLIECWGHYVQVDRGAKRITIGECEPSRSSMQAMSNPSLTKQGTSPLNLEGVAQSMRKLGIMEKILPLFCKDVEQLLISPRLQVQSDGSIRAISVHDDTICSSESSSDLSAEALFIDLQALIDFLREKLPPSLIGLLPGQLMPNILSRLISTWLVSAIPEDLDGMEDFESTLRLVQGFARHLEAIHWPGRENLDAWVADIPNVWSKKKQETILDKVRRLMVGGIDSTHVVERMETRTVSKNDEVFADGDATDDWNATWSDDEEVSSFKPAQDEAAKRNGMTVDEDLSGWGFNEDKENKDAAQQDETATNVDDTADAWGWGDDEDPPSPLIPKVASIKRVTADMRANGVEKSSRDAQQQQVTLREIYTITNLPKEALKMITQVVTDCRTLASLTYVDSQLTKCASTLSSLPVLVLALYRASSPDVYASHASGNMLLYNDCQWLAEQIYDPPAFGDLDEGYHVRLRTHASALESHGKHSYSKEMDSQRTIITDLLDGAQGFVNCTEHPFNQECDIAVASAIDRVRQLHGKWKEVLSHSALLQAVGSLLSSICSKMIVDIEDISDISEPESQQLARYCSRIVGLEDIFTPQVPEGTSTETPDIVPLTAAYVSSWLKFQYLATILESSLADIKYLWTEEGLNYEFETEELIDLVVALFAEGPHRRGAISEIRAASQAR